jgi:hypothetical protein
MGPLVDLLLHYLRIIASQHTMTAAIKVGMPTPRPTPSAILSEVLNVVPLPPAPPVVEGPSVSVD